MARNESTLTESLIGGLAGAIALTVVHQAARRIAPDSAPRMDIYGERALARGMEMFDVTPPPRKQLHWWALAGDILSNGLYYALIGTAGKNVMARGAEVGGLAGLAALILPPLMGLGRKPGARSAPTAVMTVLWYLLGGAVAAGVLKTLRDHAADTNHN